MNLNLPDYKDRLHACWIGKNIGGTMGAPYEGKLGIVEEGALADLILVNGDPLANLDLIASPAKNFSVIMKDGVVYKEAGR